MSASRQSRDRVQSLLTHHCSVQVLNSSEYSVQALMVSVALYCLQRVHEKTAYIVCKNLWKFNVKIVFYYTFSITHPKHKFP